MAGAIVATAPSAVAQDLYKTGRAYALSANITTSLQNINVPPTPDTGDVTTTANGTTAPPCIVSLSGVVSGTGLCAKVVTSDTPQPQSVGEASIVDVTVGNVFSALPPVSVAYPATPTIHATGLRATSTSTCSGSSGASTFASLAIGDVQNATTPAPNTALDLPYPAPTGSRVVLNEQTPVAGADHGLTVNALHLIVPGTADVVLGSARSDIHNCPPPPPPPPPPPSPAKAPTSLQYTGDSADGYHDAANLAAVLSDTTNPSNPQPVAGRTLVFTLGSQGCMATTGPSGSGACTIPSISQAPGPYTVNVTFAGDAQYLPSATSAGFTVLREESTLTYVGDTRTAPGRSVHLAALLREDGPPEAFVALGGRPVAFTLGSGPSAQTCSGVTDASGVAGCDISPVNQSGDSVAVTATFAGDALYLPSATTAQISLLAVMTGHAYGLSASVLNSNLVPPTPNAGPVNTDATTTVSPPCTGGAALPPVRFGVACASVTTSRSPQQSSAKASVADVSITGLTGVPDIEISGAKSSSTTTCAGASGTSSIANLRIGGVANSTSMRPNYVILDFGPPGAKIILNEQKPVPGEDQGLTVNAAHIIIPGVADVVVASSESDIFNCPRSM